MNKVIFSKYEENDNHEICFFDLNEKNTKDLIRKAYLSFLVLRIKHRTNKPIREVDVFLLIEEMEWAFFWDFNFLEEISDIITPEEVFDLEFDFKDGDEISQEAIDCIVARNIEEIYNLDYSITKELKEKNIGDIKDVYLYWAITPEKGKNTYIEISDFSANCRN